ncbi:MAG: hypothetical protein QOG63_1113 [Thermoleophilaceae bacterium]|jgi:uncharacterized protein YndB with AHSA1/START domain|nr:hypothetical protein [Thermoleophilaceae bacterium]
MPAFNASADVAAPPEEVWKLLYDPSRFPEWWPGVERVAAGDAKGGPGDVTFYPDGYPDFPMPQEIRTSGDGHNVRISCLVSDLHFEWRLEERDGGTRITVDVGIPEAEAHRVDTQRRVISESLENLAALAGAG